MQLQRAVLAETEQNFLSHAAHQEAEERARRRMLKIAADQPTVDPPQKRNSNYIIALISRVPEQCPAAPVLEYTSCIASRN